MGLFFSGCRHEETIFENEFIPNLSKQEFFIISPKFGDVWYTSLKYDIKWIPSAYAKNVIIELYRKNTIKKIVTSKTENNGLYSYLVPNDLENSNLYRIKIINYENLNEFVFSDYFSIR